MLSHPLAIDAQAFLGSASRRQYQLWEESLSCRLVAAAQGRTLPVTCSFSVTDLHGWPLAPTIARLGELSEPMPMSERGFCCRSHSKVYKMGGGHRIRTLPVAYIIWSGSSLATPLGRCARCPLDLTLHGNSKVGGGGILAAVGLLCALRLFAFLPSPHTHLFHFGVSFALFMGLTE